MKTSVAAAFAAGLLLATGAPAAHAADDFRGGCGWVGEADPTSTAWEGVMYVAVVATGSAPAFVTASCELIVNGSSFGTMLGPSSGTGLVVDATRASFSAVSSDTVVLCTHVTVNGIPFAPNCQNVAHSSVVPKIVRTAVGEVLYAVDHLPETVDDTVKSLDPTTCALLQALAPVVDDRVNQWSLLYIDPAQGDLYVLGTQDSAMVHDCPPYRV